MPMSLPSRDPVESSALGACAAPEPELTVHGLHDPRRGAVENFIRSIYARHYGAQVPHFAPVLVGLRERGQLLAAAGYRSAADQALFLERYLPVPVDTLLARHAGSAPARARIAEVGHLAATRSGEGRRLVRMLAPHLAAQGFDWVVGTVTQELRSVLLRLGIAPLILGAAEPAALGEEAALWGSYYEHQPLVLAGQLRRYAAHRRGRSEGAP
jgi:hypothetical protein